MDPPPFIRAAGRLGRRRFLGGALTLAAALTGCRSWPRDDSVFGSQSRLGGIDTHTHFYDPARPAGVPWPPPDDPVLYRPVFPPDYLKLPGAAGMTGTVVVEASPWVDDNQWILDLAARHPFIVGFVGNLPVGTPEFAGLLERFARHPVFRGIRIQGARLRTGLAETGFLRDLRLLLETGLSLDVVGGPDLLPAVARLAGELPGLAIIVDHLAGVRIDGNEPPPAWRREMELAARPADVFCKVSGLVEGTGRRGGRAPTDTEFYRPVLDVITDGFGPDRLMYGSNWPVCEHFATLETVHRLVAEYYGAAGNTTTERVFRENSRRAYRWVTRSP